MKRIPKIALLLGMFSFVFCSNTATLKAQDNKSSQKEGAEKVKKTPDGFIMLPSGLQYKVIKHGSGTRKPAINDHIEMNISYRIGDSVMFDSRKMNNDKPVPLQISQSKGKGDPVEAFRLLVVGDSAVIRFPIDSMKRGGSQMQPWMKPGTYVEYYLVLVSLKTDEEDKKENAEKAAKQKGIDDKILEAYFKKNNIKPLKTASGLYYTISKEGQGPNVQAGQTVNVDYTGMFLDGKKFDSNVDSAFHHVQPFPLEVGRGKVIKGWDEGLQLLKIGSKATFYIPSGLAYGSQDRAPQIPANSILVFTVEVSEAPDQAKVDDKLIQDYLAKNNITASKTPSGLYYTITKQGTGENAKPGQKVSMSYLGKTLDGKVFDKNVDDNFKNTRPFDFTLGKGMVIKGWDEGIGLLNLGSKATLFIPSAMAYGERGAGGRIPPNAVLIFDVEVLDIK